MNLQQALTLVNIGGQLLTSGLATAATIKTLVRGLAGPGVSDDDLNAIVMESRKDARRRVTLAEAEIAAAQAEIASRPT